MEIVTYFQLLCFVCYNSCLLRGLCLTFHPIKHTFKNASINSKINTVYMYNLWTTGGSKLSYYYFLNWANWCHNTFSLGFAFHVNTICCFLMRVKFKNYCNWKSRVDLAILLSYKSRYLKLYYPVFSIIFFKRVIVYFRHHKVMQTHYWT